MDRGSMGKRVRGDVPPMKYLVMYRDQLGRFPVLSRDVDSIEAAQELCRELRAEGHEPKEICSIDDTCEPKVLRFAARPEM